MPPMSGMPGPRWRTERRARAPNPERSVTANPAGAGRGGCPPEGPRRARRNRRAPRRCGGGEEAAGEEHRELAQEVRIGRAAEEKEVTAPAARMPTQIQVSSRGPSQRKRTARSRASGRWRGRWWSPSRRTQRFRVRRSRIGAEPQPGPKSACGHSPRLPSEGRRRPCEPRPPRRSSICSEVSRR